MEGFGLILAAFIIGYLGFYSIPNQINKSSDERIRKLNEDLEDR